MDQRKKLGNQGEDLAARFLQDQGYRIVERQYCTRFGEIDLVAYDGRELVFVEVKMRTNLAFGHPEEAVHPHKLSRMAAAGDWYLREQNLLSVPHRYDVVAITWPTGKVPEIIHFKAI